MVTSLLLPIVFTRGHQGAPIATLADFLRTANIPSYVAVAPETVRIPEKGKSLADYDRKEVRLGSITAIVPRTMVVFDDTFAQFPNLFEGLPRDAKALYLLTTLSPAQRKLASQRGLCLDDLQGESRAVLASLLPKTLSWRRIALTSAGKSKGASTEGTVEAAGMSKVRIQFVRNLFVALQRGDSPNSQEHIPTSLGWRYRDGVATYRDTSGDDDRRGETAFGVTIRKVVDNHPKKGDLDTRPLNGSVVLASGETVGQALMAAGRSAGIEILADLRVRDLSVVSNGSSVRAGDLLDALALAVGGTYRKVGGSFLLASDTVGMGARQLRLNAWAEGTKIEQHRRQAEWRSALGRNGAMRSIGYASDDPLALPEELQGEVSSGESYPTEPNVPSSALPAAMRGFIQSYIQQHGDDKLRIDRVWLEEAFSFRFVLPDGQTLAPEPYSLGNASSFGDTPARTLPTLASRQFPAVALPVEGPALPVLFRVKTVAEIDRALAEAKAHGVREIWVESDSAFILRRTVESGLTVRCVLRPFAWRAGGRPSVPDRTILGDTAEDTVRRVQNAAVPFNYLGDVRVPSEQVETLLAPDAPEWSSQVQRLATLAQTPGLAGVVVLDPVPQGYGGKGEAMWSESFPARRFALRSFGYTEGQRLAFLRNEGIDPIDLGWEPLYLPVNLNVPFFMDRALRAINGPGIIRGIHEQMRPMRGRWDEARAKTNERALQSFLAALPALPVSVQARPVLLTDSQSPNRVLFPWKRGEELVPWSTDAQELAPSLLELAPPLEEVFWGTIPLAIRKYKLPKESNGVPGALDLSSVPASQWSATLDRTLKRVGS